MQKLRELQEKESSLLDQSLKQFIPFLKERDQLGKLPNTVNKKILHRQLIRKKQENNKDSTNKSSTHSKSKVNFLKDVYSINHNTVWTNLTHVTRLEKKFNLRVDTEFVEQKPLILLNQKLQLNDGFIEHRNRTQLNNSPKLGKNLSMNTIPPIGYYQPKDLITKKQQPMLVKMNLQQETKRMQHRTVKTENGCSIIQQIPKLELSNIKIQNKIPQELFEKAYKTERQSTEHRFRYTPLHFENSELEQQEHKMNQIRQFYKVLKTCVV